MARLNKAYRLIVPQVTVLKTSLLLRQHARGAMGRSYRLAVALERRAVRRGDQITAAHLHSFVSSLVPSVVMAWPRTIQDLEMAAVKAADSEQWGAALEYILEILARDVQNPDVRLRAMANRASGLHVIGHLGEAIAAYDALMSDSEVWSRISPNYRTGYIVSREAMQWYVGEPVNFAAITEATPSMGRVPATWAGYWWLLAHVVPARMVRRMKEVRLSSLRTFGLDWRLEWDRALWGLDLLVSDKATVSIAEKRVRYALANDTTRQFIGRTSWFDLYTDWFLFLERHRPEDMAREVPRFVAWCREFGYEGWADYWQDRQGKPASCK